MEAIPTRSVRSASMKGPSAKPAKVKMTFADFFKMTIIQCIKLRLEQYLMIHFDVNSECSQKVVKLAQLCPCTKLKLRLI